MPNSGQKTKKYRKKQARPPALKPIPTADGPILSALQIFKNTIKLLWHNKKLFAGVLGIIGLVQLFVVEGIVRTDFVSINKQVNEAIGSGIGSGLLSYSYLLGSAGQSSSTGLIQTIITVLAILALLWSLRELAAGNQPRIRDAFYKSTYPLVPFILVTLWLGVQLLPALAGAWLYSIITTNGIAVHLYEQLFWLGIFLALSALSLRWAVGTILALVAVTLPDMTPMVAIRSTKQIVKGKRLLIFSKLLFLAIALLAIMTICVLPAILLAPVIVPVLFYVVSLLMFAIAVTYVYGLYKELLK